MGMSSKNPKLSRNARSKSLSLDPAALLLLEPLPLSSVEFSSSIVPDSEVDGPARNTTDAKRTENSTNPQTLLKANLSSLIILDFGCV